MRLLVLTIMLSFSTLIFGRLSGDLGFGYNFYTNNLTEYTRKEGVTIQLGLVNDLTNTFSLTYGINISIAKEKYNFQHTYWYQIDASTYVKNTYMSQDNATSINIQYPVTVITKVIEGKLFLLSGISLNIDNFLVLGDLLSLDPEIGSPNSWPQTKLLGFGYQIGILYRPFKRIGIYGEWKGTKNSKFSFSYAEIGLKYRLFINR